MTWTCDKCGITINGEPIFPIHCKCENVYYEVQANHKEWPRWTKLIRMLRTEADRGVGDTVQRIAAKFGGERFKAFSARIGMPCGCTQRQEEWNRLWPYD